MDALLPAFAEELLNQGCAPGEIPELPVAEVTGWLAPLVGRLLSVLDTCTPLDAFLAHGYVCLRVAAHSAMTVWRVPAAAVVLTVAGTVALEMYQDPDGMEGGHPQYVRSFGPEQIFAAHPGTLCATRSSPDGLQLLATDPFAPETVDRLADEECAAAVERVRWTLDGIVGIAAAGERR
ncbi:hypothetical protein ACFV80_35275 [Streptomyces sp. NPDC059862]|uniref:hypothetical protein n=1 Tax=Streptomyces sp. NPDC059862 TaxID=3346975 RepID=UPI00365BEAE7